MSTFRHLPIQAPPPAIEQYRPPKPDVTPTTIEIVRAVYVDGDIRRPGEQVTCPRWMADQVCLGGRARRM